MCQPDLECRRPTTESPKSQNPLVVCTHKRCPKDNDGLPSYSHPVLTAEACHLARWQRLELANKRRVCGFRSAHWAAKNETKGDNHVTIESQQCQLSFVVVVVWRCS